MSQPNFFSEGNAPRRSDTQWKIEQKILGAVLDSAAGGGGADQGSGAPAAPPADTTVTRFYVDTDTGVLYYWNTTTQAWT